MRGSLFGLVWLLASCGIGTSPGPSEAQIARGRAIFQQGKLASGETVTATVLGDVPMSGEQATCASCHGRSGMGTQEQGDRTPAVAAPLLFAPDPRAGRRPAYTDETLARALREGVDPQGREFEALMPRYDLSDDDLAALTAYLRDLGAEPSPGVDDDNLRIATVVAGDVDPAERKQMLDVLEAWLEVKNAQWRNEVGRAYGRREPDRPFEPWRIWHLDVWTVDGPPETWRRQLEANYAEKPVFAMMSGLADGPWAPVHEFCEDQQMPCILPNTDIPHVDAGDWYTMYFSGGMDLEARIVASELGARSEAEQVVQLVGADDRAVAAAATFSSLRSVRTVRLADRGPSAAAAALSDPATGAVVAWLTPAEWAALGEVSEAGPLVLASGTLFRDGEGHEAPPALGVRVRMVQLFRREGASDAGLSRFRAWARPRDFEVADDPRLQVQTWFACMTLLKGARHLERYPFRDFLLDSLDHAAGLSAILPVYPRPVFGPGQRTLAKGGYVVDPSGTEEPRWVVP